MRESDDQAATLEPSDRAAKRALTTMCIEETTMPDLAHDYLDLDSLFTPDELALRDRVRAFVRERIAPNIAGWYEAGHFPRELVKEMGTLGLLGMHLKGYGCAGQSAVELRAGVHGAGGRRLGAADLRLGTGLAGDERDPQVRLRGAEAALAPANGAGEAIGCFGLTEPTAGCDPASMKTFATAAKARTGCSTAPNAGSGWPPSPTWRRLGQDRRGGRPHPRLPGSHRRPRLHGQRR